jgi:uncharacterized protein
MSQSLNVSRLNAISGLAIDGSSRKETISVNVQGNKALLWEISGNGLKKPSYMLGTVHDGCSKNLALTKQQQNALGKVQQYYQEINPEISANVDDDIPNGKMLKDVLTAEEYSKVELFFKNKRNIIIKNDNTYNRKRPVPLGRFHMGDANIYNNAYVQYCKSNKAGKVDSKENILNRAVRRLNLPNLSIETVQERTANEMTLSQKEQADFLLAKIDEYSKPESSMSDYEKYVKSGEMLYNSQDIDEMDRQFTQNSLPIYNRVFQVISHGRNHLWMPRIRQAMAQKPTFFGFGVGHLGGKEGLVSLLKAEGYTLRPIFDDKSKYKDAIEPRDDAYLSMSRKGRKQVDACIAKYTKIYSKSSKNAADKSESVKILTEIGKIYGLESANMSSTVNTGEKESLKAQALRISEYFSVIASDLEKDLINYPEPEQLKSVE